MFITVLMWTCLIVFSALALGFALCAILMAMGVFFNLRKDIQMCVMFAIMLVLCIGLGTGFIFAALAMGRNLL